MVLASLVLLTTTVLEGHHTAGSLHHSHSWPSSRLTPIEGHGPKNVLTINIALHTTVESMSNSSHCFKCVYQKKKQKTIIIHLPPVSLFAPKQFQMGKKGLLKM